MPIALPFTALQTVPIGDERASPANPLRRSVPCEEGYPP